MKRIDERDIMFARMSLPKGSKEYEDYYQRNPEKQEFDDQLREMPHLMGEGTATHNPVISPVGVSAFRFLADMKQFCEGPVNPVQVEVGPEEMTKRLKGYAKYYGAKLVGITELKEEHYYSHRGRVEHYGQEIDSTHKYAIVFAVEMDRDMINRAPTIPESVEVTKGYVDAAVIGMMLSYYIRELGYEARNHMDGNYLVVAPLVAEAAGLGEIGRNGILITKEFGPRIRLGIVTTDLELITDERAEFGIKEFCGVCNKCSRLCPGRCIPQGPMGEINGVKRWQIEQEQCYRVWRSLGTDCGVCLSVCPFSQEIDPELVGKMKGNKQVMGEILKWYDEQFKVRPINRKPHEWL